MAKYEPPRDDGKKGYVVTIWDWGKTYTRTVYAKDAADARSMSDPRRLASHVKSVRRKLADESSAPPETH
jgi:hypothetical protein